MPGPTLIAAIGLGVYHGINPAMGWLFAVSFGLQRQRVSAVFAALVPIVAGHAISVAAFVLLFLAGGLVTGHGVVRLVGAIALIGFGLFKFVRPGAHPRWVGMNVRGRDLVLWSFLMATAHGAGLMFLPIVLGMSPDAGVHSHAHGGAAAATMTDVTAVLLHMGTMLTVMAVLAVVVYARVGLAILRRAWINADAFWAAALVLTGVFTLLT